MPTSLDRRRFLARSAASAAALLAAREGLAAFLREEGFATPPSETNFVFVPMASGAAELAKALEERGIRISARDPKLGLRVTVGTEDDMARFRAAFREARAALAAA